MSLLARMAGSWRSPTGSRSRESSSPCIGRHDTVIADTLRDKLKSPVLSFPVMEVGVNESMRKQDNILRQIVTRQHSRYPGWFPAGNTMAGSGLTRILFTIAPMAGKVREIRR